jgi:hypothetical protein
VFIQQLLTWLASSRRKVAKKEKKEKKTPFFDMAPIRAKCAHVLVFIQQLLTWLEVSINNAQHQ